MSTSSSDGEPLGTRFEVLSSELASLSNAIIEHGHSRDVPNVALGNVLAALVALYAEKVQAGQEPMPFGGNSRPAVTDVAIICTALMDAAGLELIELGGWQTMSGLGKLIRTPIS